MATINCICMKYGHLYGPEYVNRLGAALRRNTQSDLRFFCLTDESQGIDRTVEVLSMTSEPFDDRMEAALSRAPKHGAMKKLSMFRPGLISDLDGPLLVFDLDTAIVGSIDELRDFSPGKVCMRREFGRSKRFPSLGHGSVERFDPKLHSYLYDFMAQDPEAAVAFSKGSEQAYTSGIADQHGDLGFFPEQWVVSFKHHCRPVRPLNLFLEPRLPKDAKVVCFHGRPKMDEAVSGFSAGLFKSTKPCGWLEEAWMGEER